MKENVGQTWVEHCGSNAFRHYATYAALAKFSHRGQRTKVEILQMEWEDDGTAGGRAVDAAVALRAAAKGWLSGGDDKKYIKNDAAAAEEEGGASASSSSSWFGGGSKAGKAADKADKAGGKAAEAADVDVYALLKSPKSAAKLSAAARKAKEVLSANREAGVTVNAFAPDGADLSAGSFSAAPRSVRFLVLQRS